MTQSNITTLLLVRHGETRWNIENRFQGHGDSPLTPKGREQSITLGRRLQGIQFGELISSDLGRAMETAAVISRFSGHPLQTDHRLRERNYGVLEGLSLDEIKVRHPEILERLGSNDPDYVIPGGESYHQHYKRCIEFVEEQTADRPGTTLVLVIHGGVLDCLFRYVAHLAPDQPRCFTTINASLAVFKYGRFYGTRRWVIETWGDVAHLKDIGQYLGLG